MPDRAAVELIFEIIFGIVFLLMFWVILRLALSAAQAISKAAEAISTIANTLQQIELDIGLGGETGTPIHQLSKHVAVMAHHITTLEFTAIAPAIERAAGRLHGINRTLALTADRLLEAVDRIANIEPVKDAGPDEHPTEANS